MDRQPVPRTVWVRHWGYLAVSTQCRIVLIGAAGLRRIAGAVSRDRRVLAEPKLPPRISSQPRQPSRSNRGCHPAIEEFARFTRFVAAIYNFLRP